MFKWLAKQFPTVLLMVIALFLGAILMRMSMDPLPNDSSAPEMQLADETEEESQESPTPSETIPPSTPLPSLTPSSTLRPPPTFEPPTATVQPSLTPTVTPTAPIDLSISIPGLHGGETATPSSTPGCEPREDWQLEYEIQRNDALATIAQRYNTYTDELVKGNCITDPNVIVIGQRIRVPGQAHPHVPVIECVPWHIFTPVDGTMAVGGTGQLTFNWIGPAAPRNLIRVVRADGSIAKEYVIELRQNEVIDLADIPEAGRYSWYIYPLDWNFVQVDCREGGPWYFTKEAMPEPEEIVLPPGFP
jgi:LysM repeat protein